MLSCFDLSPFLVQNLSQGKYDLNDNSNGGGEWRDVTSPLELRAVMIKEEMKDAENLRTKLEMRDHDIKDLKKILKQKQDEVCSKKTINFKASSRALLVYWFNITTVLTY
jgi:hypothetical protein